MFDASPIRTRRLLLRPLTAGDLDDVVVYQSDAETLRYMFWPVRDRAASIEHLAERAARTHLENDGDALVLAIETLDEPGRVIGEVNLRLTSVAHRQAEIGWILNPAHQGHGFAFEAAARMVDLCFDELGSHRVHAELDARNLASAALCRRLGFREEAHFVEDVWNKGQWTDSKVFAVVEHEWRARRTSDV
ncbi:GNAT family N-acetyltransferase [Frondihabitans australicus]|uniref:RimJ/RimL family protein N-acetyltransferase n=1 Tax=Frondihabitans australicus TaxID=386892 RepID=A0A495IKC1_9MICO|nr:GNAT family protein [Frondihabitans australicus]RKR75741.1 RimJ/RimL family protein N-acetyltransferase [Frondihabitans australicus]